MNQPVQPACGARYALDRIEGGYAVLQAIEQTTAPNQVTVPMRALCAHLPAGKTRPADGTVFFYAGDGCWRPDPAATAQRQQLLREKLHRLLRRG